MNLLYSVSFIFIGSFLIQYFIISYITTYKLEDVNIKSNVNNLEIYIKEDIKNFFINQEIVDLIIENRKEEFEMFNYSKNINDIIII